MISLLGAFSQETAGLRRQMAIEEPVAGPGCTLYRGLLRGKPCLLVETGVGQRRAERAAGFVLEHYPVTALICLGFAGALTPDLKIGDVVVCSALLRGSGFDSVEGGPAAYPADSTLSDLASWDLGDGTAHFLLGTCVTVPHLVTTPQKKQELWRESQAQVVDMESYWIARMAFSRRVPFIAIRSISDTLQDDLQALDHILDSEGRLLWKRVAPYFLLHPHHLPSVVAAFRNMRRAERNLTTFVSDLVARISADS